MWYGNVHRYAHHCPLDMQELRSDASTTPAAAFSGYGLAAVVLHDGVDGAALDARSHYTCYARRDGQWLHFNDSVVRRVTQAEVLRGDHRPYMLVFRQRPAEGEDAGGIGVAEVAAADLCGR